MSRMRPGEWVAGAGSVGLLVVLFLNWFGVDGHAAGWLAYAPLGSHTLHQSGWGSLGPPVDLLVCVAIFGGLALSYMTVKRASPAFPIGAAVLTWALGSLIFLVLLLRVLLQPSLGAGLPNAAVTVQLPAYLGLLFAGLIPLGGFLSLRDERTDSAEARAYTPPPARPVPGT